MPKLLAGWWRRAVSTNIHPREATHQVAHAAAAAERGGSSCWCRRWAAGIKEIHNIRHAAARRRAAQSPNRGGAIDPRRCARFSRGRGTVKVNIEKILNVVLGTNSSVGGGGSGNRGGDGVFGKVLTLFLDGSTLDSLGTETSLADEGLRWLVVDRRKGGKLAQELLEKDWR